MKTLRQSEILARHEKEFTCTIEWPEGPCRKHARWIAVCAACGTESRLVCERCRVELSGRVGTKSCERCGRRFPASETGISFTRIGVS